MKIHYTAIMRLKLLFYIVLLSFLPISVYSQESGSCAENLKNAQSLFDKGQVVQVPSILQECMKSGFNREESLAAYRLLIQSYLFEDRLEQADSVMLEFLKKNPEYKISPTDHSSFVHLFNNFKSKTGSSDCISFWTQYAVSYIALPICQHPVNLLKVCIR